MYAYFLYFLYYIFFAADLHGYEGDYNSASAESSSEGEIDITQYYKHRASEDLQHVYHTYRGPKPAKQTRRRTVPMDLYSSGGDGEEYARYLAEVQIVDLRSRTNAEVSHLTIRVLPGARLVGNDAFFFLSFIFSRQYSVKFVTGAYNKNHDRHVWEWGCDQITAKKPPLLIETLL